MQCLRRPEGRVRSAGTRIIDNWELPGRCWDFNPHPLEEDVRSQCFLTLELSLQTHNGCYKETVTILEGKCEIGSSCYNS